MIIRNYGLHWKREYVNWGTRGSGNSGSLCGRLAKKAKEAPVDFRNQAGIYILQSEFNPVYIGQVGSKKERIFWRLKHHTNNERAERWDRFSWFGIFPIEDGVLREIDKNDNITTTTAKILDHLEAALISVIEPPLNRQGGRFGEAEQYIQFIESKTTTDQEPEE